MNYYERHLGDYARDTAHLSLVEHGAYTILLDRFYATEQGIPQDQAHRIARARTKEERAAVDAVLAEFFVLENGAYVQKRALGEIEKAQARIKAARENGRTGGRPKRNPEATHPEPTGFSDETQLKALHSPPLHSPPLHSPPSSLREESARRPTRKCPEDWNPSAELRQAMRKECPSIDQDRETAKFRDHTFGTARSDWDATWRNWIRKAVDMAPSRGKSATQPADPWPDLRHRASKIGFRDPREGEAPEVYQTYLAREEDAIRRRPAPGPQGVAKLLERRA